ncbi:transcriptional regulator NrdR [Candidatus Roizmanbacteria bacterium CG_4_10_14_0_2_um_filter_39_13]|uniref:Transcriptional repressor NrdR n=1 Tax=Candidatus Roizmanbacteria bacterium CG_4_10_14_0_2_um_filter_39_13 TaxID=1974825 RepID=A0A2M7TXS5_9BACT|nr:MAG: transcriptional regulator NrdR [Candidatus Roizmanbacteria bacterium CG_4_10_14_0_2_um_filter_39_13]
MKCLFCQNTNTEVIETRVSENRTTIRRRRSCTGCKKRFTTYERVEELPILVIKRDDRRERFDRKKLLHGIFKAVGKTTITADQVEDIVNRVEQEITNEGKTEFKSQEIGDMVAKSLKKMDKVAYIRFASVFRRFVDVEEFEKELKKLL